MAGYDSREIKTPKEVAQRESFFRVAFGNNLRNNETRNCRCNFLLLVAARGNLIIAKVSFTLVVYFAIVLLNAARFRQRIKVVTRMFSDLMYSKFVFFFFLSFFALGRLASRGVLACKVILG